MSARQRKKGGDKRGDYSNVPLVDQGELPEPQYIGVKERNPMVARISAILHALCWIGGAAFAIYHGEVIDTVQNDSRINR